MIRVVLIDALGLVRSGLGLLLTSADDFVVEAEGGDAAEGVRLAAQARPDVVLLDRNIEGLETAMRAIKDAAPACDVVVLTGRFSQVEAQSMLEKGASAYLHKDIPGHVLLGVLRAIRTPGAPRPLVPSATTPSSVVDTPPAQRPPSSNGLTSRELEVLAALATGYTDPEIAAKLDVRKGTIKTHIRNILRKLGVRNRTAAIALALRERLID